MPEITVSQEIFEKARAFKQVVEAVVEEEIAFEAYVALVLDRGIDCMLADTIASVDVATMLRSFQQLGSQYPVEVYGYVAETLKRGTAVERQRIKQRIGFRLPGEAEYERQ